MKTITTTHELAKLLRLSEEATPPESGRELSCVWTVDPWVLAFILHQPFFEFVGNDTSDRIEFTDSEFDPDSHDRMLCHDLFIDELERRIRAGVTLSPNVVFYLWSICMASAGDSLKGHAPNIGVVNADLRQPLVAMLDVLSDVVAHGAGLTIRPT